VRVSDAPARAERVAVGARVLRTVVSAQLDALGHVRWRPERVDELSLDGRENCRAVLVDGDLDDCRAVAAVDGRHERDHAIAARPRGRHVGGDAAMGFRYKRVTPRSLAGLAVAGEYEPMRPHDGVHALARHLEPFAP